MLDEDIRIKGFPIFLDMSNHIFHVATFNDFFTANFHVFRVLVIRLDLLRFVFFVYVTIAVRGVEHGGRIIIVLHGMCVVLGLGMTGIAFVVINKVLSIWKVLLICVVVGSWSVHRAGVDQAIAIL